MHPEELRRITITLEHLLHLGAGYPPPIPAKFEFGGKTRLMRGDRYVEWPMAEQKWWDEWADEREGLMLVLVLIDRRKVRKWALHEL